MSIRTLVRTTAVVLATSVSLFSSVPASPQPKVTTPPFPTPTFADVTVHDPDLVVADGTFHVFGSHLASAHSSDLMQWTQDTTQVSAANPLFDDVTQELAETFAWAQSTTLWAPDVIRLPNGKYSMYYDACKGDSPRSAMGVAVADTVTGPYSDLGIILKSGMWGLPSEDGTIYDATKHPNTVDPDVFFDTNGKLWMVYGSFSGGIFILELDPATGMPRPGQGYGKHLGGGNHARIEGAAVMHHPGTGYYYMFMTFGGLDASGGYNVRVFRSKAPDGPYLDAAGGAFADVKSDPAAPLFDDRSIEPHGVKLMGSYQWTRVVGDPGTGTGVGQVSPGGVSPHLDPATGRMSLVMHTRFPGRGETHEVRTHQMYLNADGWPVVAPYRFGGETLLPLERADQVGTYALIDHGKAITTDIATPRTIRLNQDGTISGAVTGTWERDGRNRGTVVIEGVAHQAVFSTQWNPDEQRWITTFSGLSSTGVAIWGAQRALVSPATAVARVVADLSLPASTIADLTLPTVGTQSTVGPTTISWLSSHPAVLSSTGKVTRPAAGEPDATVTLTATITNGASSATKDLTVVVLAMPAPSLVAAYDFEGDLTETSGVLDAGTVTGPKINETGGSVSYTAGQSGQALVLDGASGVRLSNRLVVGPTYAVSLWLKPAALTPFTTSFFGATSPDSWVSLLPQGHGGVGGNTMVWSGSTPWFDADTGTKIPVGEWSHVAFSVDAGQLRMWINGEQVVDRSGFPVVFVNPEGTFTLGVNWWDTPYRGQIDTLKVWNTPLSQAEVSALAQR